MIDNYDLLYNFFEILKDRDDSNNLDFFKFKNKINTKFPLVKSSFIQEIFLELDSDSDGLIKLSDLEKFLINYKENNIVR